MYRTALPADNGNLHTVFGWTDINNDPGVIVLLRTDGSLSVHNDFGTSGEIGISGPVITAETWNHIEMKVTCHATTGTVEIRVNGITVLNLTNVNTDPTGTGFLNSVNFWARYWVNNLKQVFNSFGNTVYWRDFIIWDTSGTENNDWLGTCHVYSLLPNGDVSNPWSKSDYSVDGYTLIDETDPDDADYISSDYVTNLALQSETIDNATWTKTGVTATTNVSNDGDGNATLDRITEDAASSEHGVSQSYTYASTIDHVLQVDVRDNGAGFARLSMNDGTTDFGVNFDLTSSTTDGITGGATGEAEDLGGGLWRLKIKATIGAAAAGSFSINCLDTHAGSTTYTGDNASGIEIGRVVLAEFDRFTRTYSTTTTTSVSTINADPALFDLTDLPPDIVSIKAVLPFARTIKTDGGDGNIQLGIESNGSYDLGADNPITTAFTYRWDVSEISPDTAVSYTPVEVDAIRLQIDRTT